jgi:hypothetical protein
LFGIVDRAVTIVQQGLELFHTSLMLLQTALNELQIYV